MADTIVFGNLFKEDLTLGYGTTAAVILPDGSSNTLNKIGIHTLLGVAYVSAADFAGADAGAQIAAAHTALPSTGGIIDIRSLVGAQTWTTAVTITKPTRLIFGPSTFTFSGSGTLNINQSGSSVEGVVSGGTIFKPASAYTGPFITVTGSLSTSLNGFGYGYGIDLKHFKILDGNGVFDGTGRTASCDGIVLRDTDYMHIVDVRVEFLKGTGIRIRNIRESTFINVYVLMGGDGSSKPSVWIGNAASETLTDDTNACTFYDLRIGYANSVGLLIDTGNATSIADAGIARNLVFYDIEIEGVAVNNSDGTLVIPNAFDLIQLGHCNVVKFIGGAIGNWLINNTTVCGMRVGSTSAFIADTVELFGVDFFGPSSQTFIAAQPNYGSGIVVDRINTFQMHGGRIFTSHANLPAVNITANAGRVYIDPLTRIEQLSDPLDANGQGITGTLTNLTGLYPPSAGPQEIINFASQALQVPNWVGNPASGSANLKVAANGGTSIITTDAAGSGVLILRTKAGAGGGTLSFDLDNTQLGKNLKFTGAGSHLNAGSSTDICGTLSFSAATSGSISFTTSFTDVPAVTVTPGFDLGSGHRFWLSALSTGGFTVSTDSAQSGTFFWHVIGITT